MKLDAPINLLVLTLPLALLTLGSCDKEALKRAQNLAREFPAVSRPLAADVDPLAIAAATKIPEQKARELAGLHHVQNLSPNVIVGSEPEGAGAFESLKTLGVKTVLSVDGKAPDRAAAERVGLTYVHVPILYKGIDAEHAAKIVKAFRELPAPFYVHCFHGVHRGPTAAALGRLALDGASRETTLAEMMQWCGTSKSYRGLYETVAWIDVPAETATHSLAFSFDGSESLAAFPQTMVPVSRAEGALRVLQERDWAAGPDHPDADAIHEAEFLADGFRRGQNVHGAEQRPADFKDKLASSLALAENLAKELRAYRGGAKDSKEAADATFATIRESCADCHKSYRDR